MASKAGMLRVAADVVEALASAEKYYFMRIEGGQLILSTEDGEYGDHGDELVIWEEAGIQ